MSKSTANETKDAFASRAEMRRVTKLKAKPKSGDKQAALEVKVEPKSVAEAICEDAGVPKEMADKMMVFSIG